MTETVPLNKLRLSDRNVRKTGGDEDVASLAESIRSKGLLQNLVVSRISPTSAIYEVDAGGRRLRALQLLADRKLLPENFPVPVEVVPRDDAREASLAENIHKLSMNPADEVEAFAAIVDGGETAPGLVDREARVKSCADRFGRTVRFVEQRLRLAALHPEILEALRARGISIGAAEAYASHPDQERQLTVFAKENRYHDSYSHQPESIRRELKTGVLFSDHPAALYVGLDAYTAAGGRTEADLFFGEDEREILLDVGLVEKLAEQKALPEAQRLAQAEGWRDGLVMKLDLSAPKSPKGYERQWSPPEDIGKTKRAEGIACYRIANDGSGLEAAATCWFAPKVETPPAEIHGDAGAYDYAADTRERWAGRKAAQMAAPKVQGTALEGRAYWPDADGHPWINIVQETDDGDLLVALLVKVPAADRDAALAEAERIYDLRQAELEEEAAAEAAEAEQKATA